MKFAPRFCKVKPQSFGMIAVPKPPKFELIKEEPLPWESVTAK